MNDLSKVCVVGTVCVYYFNIDYDYYSCLIICKIVNASNYFFSDVVVGQFNIKDIKELYKELLLSVIQAIC